MKTLKQNWKRILFFLFLIIMPMFVLEGCDNVYTSFGYPAEILTSSTLGSFFQYSPLNISGLIFNIIFYTVLFFILLYKPIKKLMDKFRLSRILIVISLLSIGFIWIGFKYVFPYLENFNHNLEPILQPIRFILLSPLLIVVPASYIPIIPVIHELLIPIFQLNILSIEDSSATVRSSITQIIVVTFLFGIILQTILNLIRLIYKKLFKKEKIQPPPNLKF